MRALSSIILACIGGLALLGLTATAGADQLPEYGQLSGRVTGSRSGVLPVVHAFNTAKNVGYTVFVVDGKYRAVNMIPGPYDVTVRPAVDQLEGFTTQTVKRDVTAGSSARADFALRNVGPMPNYIGGYPYEVCSRTVADCGASIEPYDVVFPPGPGREILERTCFGCHQANLISYNRVRAFPAGRAPKDKAAWAFTVDRMHKRNPNARLGSPSYFETSLLPPQDRDIVVDYLAENFGVDAPPRVIQLRSEPNLDLKALEKAMFVEYIYKEDPVKYPTWPWSHNLTFDADGNVWNAYTACCLVRTDPRTGDATAFEGNGGGSSLVVDQSDGTVWYSGDITRENGGGSVPGSPMSTIKRLDPKTGLVDKWLGGPANTMIFDTKGNLWMSAGGLTKWDRKTNSLMRWDVPVLRSGPYGVIVDNEDKVWFAEHYNSGVTRFDPETEVFTHFKLTKEEPAQIRRPGVDSKNWIWAGTWGSPNREVNGRNIGGALYGLNPQTGEVIERRLGIEHANPYTADADPFDNIWVANDNYLSKYDQKVDTFTHYPIPTRSDTLKTTITREGAVWFIYRNAGKFAGHGSTSVVLYPDKDKIKTLAAYHFDSSVNFRSSKYQGPRAPKVTGANKVALGSQNAGEYEAWALASGLPGPESRPQDDQRNDDRY